MLMVVCFGFVGWVCCGLFLFDVVLLVGLGVCFVSGLV